MRAIGLERLLAVSNRSTTPIQMLIKDLYSRKCWRIVTYSNIHSSYIGLTTEVQECQSNSSDVCIDAPTYPRALRQLAVFQNLI